MGVFGGYFGDGVPVGPAAGGLDFGIGVGVPVGPGVDGLDFGIGYANGKGTGGVMGAGPDELDGLQGEDTGLI
jgi:hypothetical protein